MPSARRSAIIPPMTSESPDPRRWIALGIVLTATFMQLVDVSIVNVAIPSIQRDLAASYAHIQLVVAAYQLTFAVLLITGGRLGDIYGRKRIFMIGMAGFTLASAACGLATHSSMLVAGRAVQGLFSALLYPQVLAVLHVTFPAHERSRAFGIMGGVVGIATIAGPLLGGSFIDWDLLGLGWRPIFLVNVPLGAASVAAAVYYLRESRSPHPLHLDIPGTLLATLGLGLLIWPLAEGRQAGWPWWAFVCLAASLVVLAFFAWYERRLTDRGASPLLNFHLFRDRGFNAGLLAALTLFLGVPAFFFAFMLFLQVGLGYGALHAGLTTLPFAVGSAIASAASIRLTPRMGKRVLYLGTLALAGGMAMLIFEIGDSGIALQSLEMLPALFVSGLGLGLSVAPLLNIVLAGVAHQEAGAASGVLSTAQRVGGAVGVTLIGVILFGLLGAHSEQTAERASRELHRALAAEGLTGVPLRRLTRQLETCVRERASTPDPTTLPRSCRQILESTSNPGESERPVTVLRDALAKARAESYVFATRHALLYEVGVFLIVGLLVVALPRAHPHAVGRSTEPVRAARGGLPRSAPPDGPESARNTR